MCRLNPLHNPYLLLRQPVELVNQGVNLLIGGINLPFEKGLLVVSLDLAELLIDRKRKASVPCVSTDLESGTGIVLDIHARLFRLEDEFMGPANSKRVIDELGGPPDLDRIFVDDFHVKLRIAFVIVDVPAGGLEDRVNGLSSKRGLVKFSPLIGSPVEFEALHKCFNRVWNRFRCLRGIHPLLM